MKVSIIGGGGRVGSDAAYALQIGGIVREIALVDANRDLADGEALDLRHGTSLAANQRVVAGDYGVVEDSNCVVITAGLRRKPDESRLELVNRNVGLFNDILDSLKQVRLPGDATLLVVSNPVDVLTTLAARKGLLPEKQVLGLGTVLDTCRFRSLLAEEFHTSATDVHALILGEHGDSMVPIWSSATVNGVKITSLPNYSDEAAQRIFENTRKAGAEVIRLKGGAGRAVGLSIKMVVESLALDTWSILPVSAMQYGVLGISGLALSMPTKVGRPGILGIVEPVVSYEECEALQRCAESLRSTLQKVEGQAGDR
jgi:L-lactate dehydrogenase